MAIRFNDQYNSEINRIVRNFNQKRNRAVKNGFKNLPDPISAKDLKSKYNNRAQLNRELTSLKRFAKSDALERVETSGGAKAIKWEYENLKRNLKYAKEYYDREIEKARRLDTDMLVSKAEYINNLKDKRAYLELELSELNQSQFKTFRKTINEYLFANERDRNNYRSWMNEVETIMRHLGYGNKDIDEFFEGFDKLTPQQFVTMYRQNAIVSRIYELYIPTNDRSFKLSTTEDDARALLETFSLEKDELIEKAKRQDKIESSGLEDFVKSLTEEKLQLRREERTGRAKLQRKDLTPEQIADLEYLGWDDILE